MTNDYIEHYKNNNISPVRQNIANINKHFYIRKKLYETLGLTNNNFENKRIIEIGPGGGYNTIYTASLKPKFYKLIEANKVGVKEIEELFKKVEIDTKNIDIENIFIEEYSTTNKFDIAICEGMLPCVTNNYEILEKIDTLIKRDGIMIITCSDEISILFDMARRFLANILLQKENVTNYEDKIDILVKAFGSHLDTLKGFGRFKEDWCADNLLGNALYNASLSVSDVIEFFKSKYSFYHLSPDIIKDETWFKEVPESISQFNELKINKFYEIWHNLIHYQVFDSVKWDRDNILKLRILCKDFIKQCKLSEEKYTYSVMSDTLKILQNIIELQKKNNANNIIIDALEDLHKFIKNDNITVSSIANDLTYFKSSFGRGQQYLSLLKV